MTTEENLNIWQQRVEVLLPVLKVALDLTQVKFELRQNSTQTIVPTRQYEALKAAVHQRSPQPDHYLLNRVSTEGLSKRHQFKLLDDIGFTTPLHGIVKSVSENTTNEYLVVYTDEMLHCGEGKLLLKKEIAVEQYPDHQNFSEKPRASISRGGIGASIEWGSMPPKSTHNLCN